MFNLKFGNERRLKIMRIHPVILKDLFQANTEKHYKIIENGLPADAKILNAQYGMSGEIEFLVTSKTFPEVKEGGIIPDYGYMTAKTL